MAHNANSQEDAVSTKFMPYDALNLVVLDAQRPRHRLQRANYWSCDHFLHLVTKSVTIFCRRAPNGVHSRAGNSALSFLGETAPNRHSRTTRRAAAREPPHPPHA